MRECIRKTRKTLGKNRLTSVTSRQKKKQETPKKHKKQNKRVGWGWGRFSKDAHEKLDEGEGRGHAKVGSLSRQGGDYVGVT